MDGTFVGMASATGGSVELRSSPERPSFALSDPAAWEMLLGGGSESESGARVTPENSLSIASVWQAVAMISGDIARLPLNVYRRTEEGREVDKLHPAWWLVHEQPNDEVHAFRFWRTLMVHALLWGNGYAFVERDAGARPVGLYNLLPDRTSIYRDPKTRKLVYATETTKPDGSPWLRALWPHEVLHISGLSIDGTEGSRLVRSARHAWGLAISRQKFESKYFKHGARAGGILELPLGSGEKFQDNVTEGWKRHNEGEGNWFKTAILRDGVKFHQTSFNAKESQLTESSERGAREVARFFNLAPSRLGVEGSTSYNSKHEDNQAYLDSTLSTWLSDIVAECKSKLLSEQERRETHYLEHNAAVLLNMNLLQRYQAYAIGVRNRWLTPNMVLSKENEPKVDWGDDPVPVPGAAGGADKGENSKPRGPASDAEGEDSERQLLVRRVMFRLTDHARAKASKGHRAFGEWLASGMATHRQFARQLLGDDEIVDRFTAGLQALEACPVQELAGRVESITQTFEREV